MFKGGYSGSSTRPGAEKQGGDGESATRAVSSPRDNREGFDLTPSGGGYKLYRHKNTELMRSKGTKNLLFGTPRLPSEPVRLLRASLSTTATTCCGGEPHRYDPRSSLYSPSSRVLFRFLNIGLPEYSRLLKNTSTLATDPPSSLKSTIFGTSEPDLSPSMDLRPTFSTRCVLLGSSVNKRRKARFLQNSSSNPLTAFPLFGHCNIAS